MGGNKDGTGTSSIGSPSAGSTSNLDNSVRNSQGVFASISKSLTSANMDGNNTSAAGTNNASVEMSTPTGGSASANTDEIYNSGVERVADKMLSSISKSLHRKGYPGLIDMSTASVASSDTSPSLSSLFGLDQFQNAIVSSTSSSNTKPTSHYMFESIMEKMEETATQYMGAMYVGALMGAAVVSGLFVGVVTCSGIVVGLRDIPSMVWSWYRHRRLQYFPHRSTDSSSPALQNTSDSSSDLEQHQTTSREFKREENTAVFSDMRHQADVVHVGGNFRRSGDFFLIQGRVSNHSSSSSSSSNDSTEDNIPNQCRECLDYIGVALGKQRLGWNHVCKVTAYLVTDRCDAQTFRTILSEYPIGNNNMTNQHKNTMITIVYVQRLEQEHAPLQVEVMASDSS